MADLDPCAQPRVPDGGGCPSPLFVTPALRLPAKAGDQVELPAGQAGVQLGSRLRGNDEGLVVGALGSRLRGNDEGEGGGASSLPALVDAQPGLFTRERQVVFLHALAATGAVRSAAARCGVSHQTAYRARLGDAVFARGWNAALLAARAHAEEVLAVRAIDGVEEEVMYHGEVVATRRRFDARLLLAHLARLDRLTADARVEAFAGDFEAALERFGEGSDAPETAPPAAKMKKSSGEWSRRSKGGGKSKAPPECPECGGKCKGPEDELTEDDCQWLGNRLERMDAARPPGAKEPHAFADFERGAVEAEQLAAFEAGEDDWWCVVPAGPGEDPGDWHFAD